MGVSWVAATIWAKLQVRVVVVVVKRILKDSDPKNSLKTTETETG